MSAREAVARAICKKHLGLTDSTTFDMWKEFKAPADAAITAHLAWLEDNGFVVVEKTEVEVSDYPVGTYEFLQSLKAAKD